MPERGIDPETGELALTHPDKILIDAYTANGAEVVTTIRVQLHPPHAASIARLHGIDSSARGPG